MLNPDSPGMPARATTTPTSPQWPLVLILGALTAFSPMAVDMYLPGLPAIARDFGVSGASARATLASLFIGLAVGQVLYGPVSDRIGRRIPLLAGIILFCLASVGCAFATSLNALTALRFIQALGGCAGPVIARAIVRDRFAPHEVASIYSLLALVMGAAPILAPLLGGLVLALADWRAIFWTLALFGVLCGAAAFLFLPESRSDAVHLQAKQESPIGAYRAVAGNPRLLGYVLTGGFSAMAMFGYIAASPQILIEHFGISPSHFGWAFGANALGFIAAGQVNRVLLRRFDFDRILRWSTLAAIGGGGLLLMGALFEPGGMWGVLVPLFLIQLVHGFTAPNAMAGAMTADSLRIGSASAFFGAVQFACAALSASLVTLIDDGTARPMAAIILVTVIGAAVALRALVRRD